MEGAILTPCVHPTQCYKANGNNVYSLQMSPDFTGAPFHPGGGAVDYTLNKHLPYHVTVGGGLVQTFAFGGPAPSDESGGNSGKLTHMPPPRHPFTLRQAAAISSCALASVMNVASIDDMIPRLELWPVRPQKHENGNVYLMGDGGNIENAGLLPMLQRNA